MTIDTRAVDIHSTSDIRRAAESLRDAALEMGSYRVIVSHNIASKQPMVDEDGVILAEEVFGFTKPEERWWSDPQIALYSPIAKACRYENEPFWVNALGYHTRSPNRYLDEIDLSKFEKQTTSKALIVVPVHLPFGQIGVAAFATTGAEADISAAFEVQAETLMLLSQRFVSGYVKVTRTRRWFPADCRLTKREVDCLRWAAIGKTDREISLIIGRSHATVRFHIQNAGEKLDAVNRSQAIFKASQLGYLGLAN